MSQKTAENDTSVLGDVIDLHETAMSTDRDSPRADEDHTSPSKNPHPRKSTWPGLEADDHWSIDYDNYKGNILLTKKMIPAHQVVLKDQASVLHPIKERLLKTCTHCSKEVVQIQGRLPPIYCDDCHPEWREAECDAFCTLWPTAWKKGLVVHCLRILHTVCAMSPIELAEFSKLDPHFPSHTVDLNDSWNQAALLVSQHLQAPELQKLEDLGALFGQEFIKINKITNANSFGTNVVGIFLKASLISHSCNPNCKWEMDGPKLTITSLRDIKPHEEITVQYIPMVQSWHVAIRRTVILQRRGFLCHCERCVSEVTGDK